MADIQWDKLGFEYMPTKSHIRHSYKNGKWDEGTLSSDHNVTLPIAATSLHYGQTVFEGLKAFRQKNGDVALFRPLENAKRLNFSLRRILAEEVPEDLFLEAVKRVVRDNIEFIPPYGTGGSLYIRPFAFGSGARIGVASSDEYEFITLVVPVGAYYKGGIKPVDAMIVNDYDRAAPLGTGQIKLGGNYAASLLPSKKAKEKGFPITLFLDAREHKYVDEFGTSNFIGITKDGKYVTPSSESILRSITNKSLMQLCETLDIPVEQRQINIDEVPDFAEVGACGTAVVITPVGRIVYGDKEFTYGDECGPILRKLYDRVTGIQFGELPDEFNWMEKI